MSVAGYEKVKTKVIEGKKKCIYKKPNGTKLYVKGFKKMRTIENYIKLCKKAAANSATKSATKPVAKSITKSVTKPAAKPATKPVKTKKMRSKSAKKYGGFIEEFFANIENSSEGSKEEKNKDGGKASDMPASPASPTPHVHEDANQHFTNPNPTYKSPPTIATKKGGSSCQRQGGGNQMISDFSKMLSVTGGYRGGQSLNQFQDLSQEGGRRKKRNKGAKSMLDKLMMAANFGKRRNNKGKKPLRKGGDAIADSANALGSFTDSLMKTGGKKGGSSSQLDY